MSFEMEIIHGQEIVFLRIFFSCFIVHLVLIQFDDHFSHILSIKKSNEGINGMIDS